jgi:hypothetical protein
LPSPNTNPKPIKYKRNNNNNQKKYQNHHKKSNLKKLKKVPDFKRKKDHRVPMSISPLTSFSNCKRR